MKKLFILISFLLMVTVVSAQPIGGGGIYGSPVGFGTMTNSKYCIYVSATNTIVCNSEGGSGTVDISGTPANHYWTSWVDADTIKGTTITASKPVCSDASGDPAVCAGTEGVWQVSNAILAALSGLTPAENAVVGWTTGPTLAALTSHSHSDSAAQFYSATPSKGTLKFDQTGISDKKVFTIKAISDADVTFSPGKTWTDGKWCSYATATGLTCNETPGAGTGDLLADGSVKWTAAPEPNAANTIALGSATAEWSDIFLGDGAVINLGNDQDVKITHVADSGIKLEANSEDLTLAATANTWTLSSSTGVDKISLTAMNLVTTGYIDGGILVTKSTNATITVSGMTGFYINADDDAIAFNLPADPTNKAFCFANLLYAKAITVNPDDADYIVHAGTTASAGEAYVSSGARTDQLCVVGIDTGYWLVTSERGTWAEETT